jgi:cytochrome c-type biogenesis protein CcmH/NrfG
MGNAHDKLGAPQQAAAAFRTAFELDPTDASAAYNLANAYRSLGQTDDAVQMYTAALRFTPRDAIKHTNLAHTLDAAGRYEEATASFTTALTLAPTDAGTYTALGHAFKSSGQLEKAVAAYKGALALEPAAAGAYAGMGSALKQIDPKAAAEAYAAAAGQEATGQEADEASAVKAWLDASPPSPPLPSARASGAREWAQVKADARYPPAFEGRAKGCARMPMSEAIKMGSEALLKLGPTLLTNATSGWQLQKWSDANLTDQAGSSPLHTTPFTPPLPLHHSLHTTTFTPLPSHHSLHAAAGPRLPFHRCLLAGGKLADAHAGHADRRPPDPRASACCPRRARLLARLLPRLPALARPVGRHRGVRRLRRADELAQAAAAPQAGLPTHRAARYVLPHQRRPNAHANARAHAPSASPRWLPVPVPPCLPPSTAFVWGMPRRQADHGQLVGGRPLDEERPAL